MEALVLIGLLIVALLPFFLWATWSAHKEGIPSASRELRYGIEEDSAGIDSADSGA